MEFLINNIDAIVIALVFIAGGVLAVIKLVKTPKDQIIEQVMGWLLQAVLLAEKEYGSGTGALKLSSVYDKFCEKLPWAAKLLTFEEFGVYVDKALVTMRLMLENNNAIASIVVTNEPVADEPQK